LDEDEHVVIFYLNQKINVMNRLLFVIAILMTVGTATAQTDPEAITFPARHAFKVNVLQMVSFYPTIPLAYEVRIAPQHSLQFEAGYVFSVEGSEMYANKRGAKLRTGWRWYVSNLTRSKSTHDYFMLEPYANIIDFDRQTNTVDCSTGNCVERTYYRTIKNRESGVGLKWGHIGYGKHVVYDVNVGVRLRNVRYDDNEPADNDITIFSLPQINENDRLALGFVVGFSLGWRSQ
jgi:hypothetical protein